MYLVYFEPDKQWWEFWKRSRYLVEGKDYKVTNGYFVAMKLLRGKVVAKYNLNNKIK